MPMRVLPMGQAAVIVENPPGDPARWGTGLRMLELPGVVDVVPAARTVLIRAADATGLHSIVERLDDVVEAADDVDGERIVIEVMYDGDDLADVARAIGGTVDEVVALHRSAEYRVAFCGFAPGFGYLAGLPDRLHLPRRSSPRTRVPAGSVAIAAEYSAVYPRVSPGGWHLIGRTSRVLFDIENDPPTVLRPGTVVRFEAV